jgi:RNA ligase (TIGR02306 family)
MNPLATVEKIFRIYPHPNADSLECAEVRQCQVIISKGKYTAGDKIAFIWPDTLLPDSQWAAFYKAKSSRVRAVKLRGEWSMGIIESLENIFNDSANQKSGSELNDAALGTEISHLIGVSKYEPPPPKDLGAKGPLPFGIPKTDEENHYKFNDLPYGSLCDVTRKRDGSSCSFYYHLSSDTFGVCSRSLDLKPELLNAYTEHVCQYNIENKLREYCKKHQLS